MIMSSTLQSKAMPISSGPMLRVVAGTGKKHALQLQPNATRELLGAIILRANARALGRRS